MKILVTGSAGHLGEALMRTLQAGPHEAVGIDVLDSPFTTHRGSIADAAFVARCMRGVDAVLHTATLHKPHVATHARQAFVDVNVTGTLALLDAAAAEGVKAFVFTSTTSTFGMALSPGPGRPAAWITEDVVPVPKNIYGVTKVAAEDLCELAWRLHRLPTVVLRTSRFFPEPDDDAGRREAYADDNLKVAELLYRRVDIADVVDAHLRAIDHAPAAGHARYVVSATTPFGPDDLAALGRDLPGLLWPRMPDAEAEFARRGWRLLPALDRVYVNDRARAALGWQPRYDFAAAIDALRRGDDFRSPLAREVGAKGYHRASG